MKALIFEISSLCFARARHERVEGVGKIGQPAIARIVFGQFDDEFLALLGPLLARGFLPGQLRLALCLAFHLGDGYLGAVDRRRDWFVGEGAARRKKVKSEQCKVQSDKCITNDAKGKPSLRHCIYHFAFITLHFAF